MKYSKTLLAFVILLTVSCKKDTKLKTTKATGTIETQTATTYQYGTHVLTDDAGNTLYALRSTSVKLDEYLHRKVELKGHIVKGYPISGGPEYIDVSKIE